MLVMIGLLCSAKGNVEGIRIYNTNSYKTMDITYDSAVSALKNKKAIIENIKVEGNRIKTIDDKEKLADYPCILSSDKRTILRNKESLTILGYNNNGITISNYEGIEVTLSLNDIRNWEIMRNKGEIMNIVMEQKNERELVVTQQIEILSNRLTNSICKGLEQGIKEAVLPVTNTFKLEYRLLDKKCNLALAFEDNREKPRVKVEFNSIDEIGISINNGIRTLLCRI